MKPIWKIMAIICLSSNIRCQKYQQNQYPFPPHFQTPNTPMFSSDSTIYLPPESSTPTPYFSGNNMNKYPVKYLPATAVKAPSIYPTPFPSVSSSARPDFEEELQNFREISKLHPAHQTAQVNKNLTNTNNNIGQQAERREMKTIHRMPSFQEKIDNFKNFENMEQKKPQFPATLMQTHNTLNQNPASRRMIVTSEMQRNENTIDQAKAASYANAQYIQAPGVIIASTEPAIPILRLSNEMDLDGSFSYEALGADQTHYVQHSRMENMGTDKEEQVVEGSYSYVGDNGQTYTVHYVADANGYRASGDHLPVAPPIPEIIQRAVQYNLAEEARKPSNLKQSWETESKDYENDESSNRYTITSLRNLFTGRTPEAFSLGFAQGSNSQNNLMPSASSNIPVKATYEVMSDPNKPKSNSPIAPQVTFLATQGAHNPSSQTQQVQARIVSTERPTMPQIVNYEATVKEVDPEANKGLWRWQYGLNANDNSNPNRNTISRSSGEKDDVIINFTDMNPEQYTRMLHAEISGQQVTGDSSTFLDNSNMNTIYNAVNTNYPPSNEVVVIKTNNDPIESHNDFYKSEYTSTTTSTETSVPSTTTNSPNEYVNAYQTKNTDELDQTNIYAKIISSQNFVPKSSIVTQTYDIEDATNDIHIDIARKPNPSTEKTSIVEEVVKSETKYPYFDSTWMKNNYEGLSSTDIPVSDTSEINSKIAEIVTKKNDFKPVTVFDQYYETTTKPNSGDSTDEESLNKNIFLRNLLIPKASEYKSVNKIYNALPKEKHLYDSYQVDPKEDKAPKILQYQPSPQNEIKFTQKKPFDINDVLNYVTLKNHFESSKMRPKNAASVNLSQNYNHKEMRSIRYMPTESDKENDGAEDSNDSYQVRNNQREMHGVIKNYKVLQRQRNNNHASNYPELTHRNIKTFHNLGLPPLGRAGPSLKSYLPPTFV